jgi:hypothetical protein
VTPKIINLSLREKPSRHFGYYWYVEEGKEVKDSSAHTLMLTRQQAEPDPPERIRMALKEE